MDIEEDAKTFLWCKRRRLEKVTQRGDDDAFDAMETTMETSALGGVVVFIGLDNRYIQQFY